MPGYNQIGTILGTSTRTADDFENDGETLELGEPCRGIDFIETSGNEATITLASLVLLVPANGSWSGSVEASFTSVTVTGSTSFYLNGLV